MLQNTRRQNGEADYVRERVQAQWSNFVVRWGCASGNDAAAQRDGLLADMPLFIVADPAHDMAQEAAWMILDAFAALCAMRPEGPSYDEVLEVWNSATRAWERRLAERTIMADTPECEEIPVVCLVASHRDQEPVWVVVESGGMEILEVNDDASVKPLVFSSETCQEQKIPTLRSGVMDMRVGQRFVLATEEIRISLRRTRQSALTQRPRAERAAATIIASGEEAASMIIVDVMTPEKAQSLESPPTLMEEQQIECNPVEHVDSALGLRALGVDDSRRRRHLRRTHTPPPELSDFRFISYLGSGGFSDVYLYEEQLPKRLVAIKVLAMERSMKASAGNSSQFRAEVDLMAQLSGHPSVVTIHDAALAPSGQPYVVMQYCPMPSLAERIARGEINPAEALKMGVQVASAVHTAHVMGIMHHDLKPANVLYSEFGRPLLGDFGIASLMSESTTEVMGMSLPWAAPEVLCQQPASASADVYSLAATVYTALEGRAPFSVTPGRSRAEYAARVANMQVPSPILKGIPQEAARTLREALGRALLKEPAERTASAADFGRDLQRVQILMGGQSTDLEIPVEN